ncbi:hypothetical protein SAMN02745687_00991 [Lachnospiraceae bacterium NK3A20]|nr:hypothetical protein SAMN02745687_00991 [Lachnospiraceae bacterium NK3A20]
MSRSYKKNPVFKDSTRKGATYKSGKQIANRTVRRKADEFVRQYVPAKYYSNADAVIDTINSFGSGELWQTAFPLWYRPQHYGGKLYKSRIFLQVVGHTPVETITKKGNLISCDVFSTYRDGKPIGTQEFPIIDTDTREYVGIH